MTSTFVVAIVSGLFAGIVASGVTVAIERFGGLVGGVLATVPTTILPAMIGIAWEVGAGRHPDNIDSNRELTQAGFAVPLAMLADVVFLLQWRLWPDRLDPGISFRCKLASMIAISLVVWAICAGIAGAVSEFAASATSQSGSVLAGVIALCISVCIGVATTWNAMPSPKGENVVTWGGVLARGAFAGLSIFVAVMIGASSAAFAGVMAVFPAIFLTTMVALWVSQGEAVSIGAVGPMMLGSASVPAFSILYALLVPHVGTGGAAVLGWPLSVLLVSVPAVSFLQWRELVAEDRNNALDRASHIRLEEMEDEAFDMSPRSASVVLAVSGASRSIPGDGGDDRFLQDKGGISLHAASGRSTGQNGPGVDSIDIEAPAGYFDNESPLAAGSQASDSPIV